MGQTFSWRTAWAPRRPQLDHEERAPAHRVCHYDNKSHLHGLHLGVGHPLHHARASCLQRLPLHVEVDRRAYSYLTVEQNDRGQSIHRQGDPADVDPAPPRFDKRRPAVVLVLLHLLQREDEELRGAEGEGDQPRCAYGEIPPEGALQEGNHGFTNRMVPVYGHSYYHVSGGEHPDHLQVLYCAAQEVRASEPVRNFNEKLRQDLEKSHHQIGQAQVQEEQLGPGVSFTLLPQCAEEEEVTARCEHKHQTQNPSSEEREVSVRFSIFVRRLFGAVAAGIHLSMKRTPDYSSSHFRLQLTSHCGYQELECCTVGAETSPDTFSSFARVLQVTEAAVRRKVVHLKGRGGSVETQCQCQANEMCT